MVKTDIFLGDTSKQNAILKKCAPKNVPTHPMSRINPMIFFSNGWKKLKNSYASIGNIT